MTNKIISASSPVDTEIPRIEIISAKEFQEAWDWLYHHISVDMSLIKEHGYYLDHKHWQYPDFIICVDEGENADLYLARLYLIGQLTSVSDYLPDLKNDSIEYSLIYPSSQLDEDVGRVLRSQETAKNLNAFRNSLSEILAYWSILATIIKKAGYQDFSIAKPNLQPEDKGPDGLACVICDSYTIVKIVSIKNSITSPKDLVSSAGFRNKKEPDLNEKKILDEFYSFRFRNRGFQRLDDKLNALMQELNKEASNEIRVALLTNDGQFNASVIADEQYAAVDLFEGFNKIANKANRCKGIYIGSKCWKNFADLVQVQAKYILTSKGISI